MDYNTLIKIKFDLGLINFEVNKIIINKIPKLLIVDTYQKSTQGRVDRIQAIELLLTKDNIDYDIMLKNI